MKLRRIQCAMLAMLMVGAFLTGCTPNEEKDLNTPIEGATPTDDGSTNKKVKILANITGGKDDNETELFEKALSEATGLEIEIEKPASDYDNVLMQKIGSGEEYDLIYLGADKYLNLQQQDALMDITDKVKASTILTENIESKEWEDITIDGKIYGAFNKKELFRVVTLNNAHLKKAEIDYKTIEPTLDGYYEVFKALKENIETDGYYPLNIVLSEAYDLQPWMAVNGLKSGVVTDDDGETYVPYSTQESAEIWSWLKKLYDEDILNPASFVDKTKDLRAKQGAASEQSSVVVDWAMWVGLHNANAATEGISIDDYEAVSLPGVKGEDGNYMLTKGGASLFAVPANAPNVDGAIKVLEFFATQEGGELLSIGILDHDYTITDGKYELTEIGQKHSSDHGAPSPIYKNFKHPIGYNLGVDEALSYGEYASIEENVPNFKDYSEIVGKWGIQIIKGDVEVNEGLKKMNEELISREVCTK